jgi:hypothetical protein
MIDTNARGVGRQMWRCEEIAVKKGDVGSQWSGSDPAARFRNNGGNMVYEVSSQLGERV